LADGQAVLLGKVLIASGSAERSSQLNSSLVITSNRPPQDWITLFPDPVMANSALDRLSHHAQHLIMEGESYRKKLKPKTSNPSTSKGAN
jgi:DNA replication protein DnaC